MLKKNALLRALLAAGLTTGLAACGGGSSSSGGSGSDTASVRAIDGYLANADIYIDSDQDGILDDSERASKVGSTDGDGFVQIPGDSFKGQLLVEAVAGQTVDSDSGAVSETFVLTAPQGSSYITPFTHLAQSTGNSYADIAKDLGVPESVVSGDYIVAQGDSDAEKAKSAEIAHAIARFIVKETKKQTTTDLISKNLIQATAQVKARVENGEDPALVEIELENGSTIVDAEPSKLVFGKAELEQTTWTMFRFDDAGDNEIMYLQLGTTNAPTGMCIANDDGKTFSFLTDGQSPTIPDKGTCEDGNYEVTDNGKLKLSFTEGNEVAEYTVLYRNKEAMGDVEVQTFVMVSDVGELFWLDNNLTLEDAGDYVIAENNTRYMFGDDDGARSSIEYYRGERQFKITGDQPYVVSGEPRNLNTGTILFGDIGSPTYETTFNSIPAYEDFTQILPGNDDILVVRENKSQENHLHHHFMYRNSGDLELMLDYKTDGNSENLYLQSGNKVLIENIADEVEARNSGVQGGA